MRAGKRWSKRIDSLPRAMATKQVTEQNLDLHGGVRGCVQKRVLDAVEMYVGHAPSGQVRIEKEYRTFRGSEC